MALGVDNVLGHLLANPCRCEFPDIGRVESGGVYPVRFQESRSIGRTGPAVPLHFVPTALLHHFKSMSRVGDVCPQPGGKCDVAWYERGIVPSGDESQALRVFGGIEQAYGDALQLVARRGGINLRRRHRIATQQKVLPLALNSNGPLHCFLNGLMSPAKAPFRRAGHVGQFAGFKLLGELCRHDLPDSRLTHSTGARDQEKHNN